MSAERWVFDPQFSSVWFHVSQLGASQARGTFRAWHGHVDIDSAGLADSTVELQIDAASIDTGDAALDAIATGPEVLDVARFPNITFAGDEVAVLDSHHMRVVGLLTVRNVTRPVAVDVTWRGEVPEEDGTSRLGFAAKATIDRKDFGLSASSFAGTGAESLVGDTVNLTFEIESVNAPKDEPAG